MNWPASWIAIIAVTLVPGRQAGAEEPLRIQLAQTLKARQLDTPEQGMYATLTTAPEHERVFLLRCSAQLSCLRRADGVDNAASVGNEALSEWLLDMRRISKDSGIAAPMWYALAGDFVAVMSDDGQETTASALSIASPQSAKRFSDVVIAFGNGHAEMQIEVAFSVSEGALPKELLLRGVRVSIAEKAPAGTDRTTQRGSTASRAQQLAPTPYKLVTDVTICPPDAVVFLKKVMNKYGLDSLSAPCTTKVLPTQVIAKYGDPDEVTQQNVAVTSGAREFRTVYWYGPIGLGAKERQTISHLFCRDRPRGFWKALDFHELSLTTLAVVAPLERFRHASTPVLQYGVDEPTKPVQKPHDAQSKLPPFTEELAGSNEVRIRNPNEYEVSVGIRLGKKGKDLRVPMQGVHSTSVPDGRYDIYFVYSNQPTALFQGESFTLQRNGVEIQLVKVIGGNYGIHRVR